MKSKKSFLLEKYKSCFEYLSESKIYIYSSLIFFIFFIFLGIFLPVPNMIKEKILEFISDLILKTENFSLFQLIRFIFFNNVQVSFFSLFFGLFFGLFSAIIILVNGYLIGFVISLTVGLKGISSIWALIPHGIFEIPAFLISTGLGLKMGTIIFMKDKKQSFKNYFLKSFQVFLLVVIPLLFIASIVESFLIFFISN